MACKVKLAVSLASLSFQAEKLFAWQVDAACLANPFSFLRFLGHLCNVPIRFHPSNACFQSLNPSSVKVFELWLTPKTRQGKQNAASLSVEYSSHGRPLYQLLLNDLATDPATEVAGYFFKSGWLGVQVLRSLADDIGANDAFSRSSDPNAERVASTELIGIEGGRGFDDSFGTMVIFSEGHFTPKKVYEIFKILGFFQDLRDF